MTNLRPAHGHEAPGPLYRRTADEIERLIISTPLTDRAPLPPEAALMADLGVSRGTLRRAIDLLVQEGLLHVQAGRGTFVDQATKIRKLVWQQLSEVARPDSRFDRDLSRFVPDFEDRELADQHLLELDPVVTARRAFVAPDNSLEAVRAELLRRRTDLIVPTYNLQRGLVHIDAHKVPTASAQLAATLDGMERFGEHLTVERLRQLGPVDVVISGAVATTARGVHFGSGAGNLDLEWSLLRHTGVATESTPVILSVHGCQVLDADLSPGPRDVVADVIVTPETTIRCENEFTKPDESSWLATRARHRLIRALTID